MTARMGQLKRAAEMLGVSSSDLRAQGWTTASEARVAAVLADRPSWLRQAQVARRARRDAKRGRGRRRAMADRLGVQARAVRERDVQLGEVNGLLAAPPDWLETERERRQLQVEREGRDRLRVDLRTALQDSVRDSWFRDWKDALNPTDADLVDEYWAAEYGRARGLARDLVDELTPEQVLAARGWQPGQGDRRD